ncbi:hypothetical protein [Streptomyces sp. A012304]|uniref:hypothetical protein n=1 Tax=Streptomyces sp. A012304 TaxID=375446 RepID=UPI00222F5D9F|nr:hypothetical protein [Streptomyces sp. A012304]GKQ40340.1 hypothetical protein ALMP_68660 [Streptomyces sp. A012304]
MSDKTSSTESWDPTVLYPDLDMSDGLSEALKRRAAGLGLSLDGLVEGFGAELATERGTVSVYVGTQERFFGVKIYEPDVVVWATGATVDVDQALHAVAAWQRGESLDDFVSEFPFMQPGTLARAYAEGGLTEGKWQELLDSQYPTGGQRLLVSLAPFAELRSFYPDISYNELRFTMPPPRRGDRGFRVQKDGPGFHVEESGPQRREYTLDALDEVARRIVEFFASG